MYIILDQGIFDMRNLGQNALLRSAVMRVKKLWPKASIGVTTFAPYLLKMFYPDVIPVSPDGSHEWFRDRNKYNRILHLIPTTVLRALFEIREEIWHRWPGFSPRAIRSTLRSRLRLSSKSSEAPKPGMLDQMNAGQPDYTSVVSGADLFIATGSQYMCDHTMDTAFQVLARLEAAVRCGIPTAMVGQGIGPIEDAALRTRAREVLPLVDMIFVREKLVASELLTSLGVDPAKIVVTGDDAIELAYKSRSSLLGGGIGVSMRCMPSTEVSKVDLSPIRTVLQERAQKHNAGLVGLPISLSIHERDDLCTQQLISGYKKTWMSHRKIQRSLEYIKDIQRCRMVITGTFHGAVLSLAQGIPVICLVKSSLYANKFQGLADLFGSGCEIISLEDESLQTHLSASIDAMWNSAEMLRVQLLEAAVRQIDWGTAAYQRLFELVEAKRTV